MGSLDVLVRGDLLASDAEREHCALALRHHYAAGRLEADELEERLGLATRARTQGELRRITRDLPREPRPPRPAGPLSHEAVHSHVVAFLVVNGGLTALWWVTGKGVYWPGLVLAPWSMLLATHVLMRRAALRLRAAVTRRLPGPR